mgnify:FL=1
MSRFKQYGSRSRSSEQNIVTHQYAQQTNIITTDSRGQNNSKIVTASDTDLSGNSMLNINTLYYVDGSQQSSAKGGTTGPTGLIGPDGARGVTGFAKAETGPTGLTGITGTNEFNRGST